MASNYFKKIKKKAATVKKLYKILFFVIVYGFKFCYIFDLMYSFELKICSNYSIYKISTQIKERRYNKNYLGKKFCLLLFCYKEYMLVFFERKKNTLNANQNVCGDYIIA